MKLISQFLIVAALAVCAFGMHAKSISILIVDGQNNHNWKAMTPDMESGVYEVRRGDQQLQRAGMAQAGEGGV